MRENAKHDQEIINLLYNCTLKILKAKEYRKDVIIKELRRLSKKKYKIPLKKHNKQSEESKGVSKLSKNQIDSVRKAVINTINLVVSLAERKSNKEIEILDDKINVAEKQSNKSMIELSEISQNFMNNLMNELKIASNSKLYKLLDRAVAFESRRVVSRIMKKTLESFKKYLN